MPTAPDHCKVGGPSSMGVDLASSCSSDLLSASIAPFLAWSVEARSGCGSGSGELQSGWILLMSVSWRFTLGMELVFSSDLVL
jgi:hypothetical protein